MGRKNKRHKIPKNAIQPDTSKTAKSQKPRAGKIIWSFALFDHVISWGQHPNDNKSFRYVGSRLKETEGRSWTEIEADRHRDHCVTLDKLTPAARKRLRVLRQDDIDELWRFRFTGTERLWGIRSADEFRVLWWDPTHSVCPSAKRHT